MNSLIFYQDLKSIEELSYNDDFSFSIKFNNFEQCWQGFILIQEEKFYFKIFIPSLYPRIQPILYSFTDDTFSILQIYPEWMAHRFPDRSLCLFTNDLRKSGWKHKYRIGDILIKFHTLIHNTLNKSLDYSHISEDFNIYDFSTIGNAYISENHFKRLLNRNGRFCQFYIFPPIEHTSKNYSVVRFFVFFSDFNKKERDFFNGIPIHMAQIKLLSQKKFNELKEKIPNKYKFFDFLVENELISNNIKNRVKWFLLINEENPLSESILILIETGTLEHIIFPIVMKGFNLYYWVINEDKNSFFNAIFKRPADYLGERMMSLESKKVIIVGIGSLGAKVAEELARNGIKHFALFDYDYYKPENVARHIAPLSSVGKPKVEVVKDVIQNISPKIDVNTYNGSPFQPNFFKSFKNMLKKYDLAVIAIDAPGYENEINLQCVHNNIPAIYSICLENAHFGRIFRVIPGKTACYECINSQIEAFPRDFPHLEIEKNIPKTESPYYQPGVPGLNLNIWEIALKTVRLCLQTLAKGTSIEFKIPDSTWDHIIIGNQKGWIFDGPYQIIPQNFIRLEDCSICGMLKKDKSIKELKEEFNSLKDKYTI